MIASLSMYDRPETSGANDQLWRLISEALLDRGIKSPRHLDRTTDPWDVWASPQLVLSQTCGLPYRAKLYDLVHLVASPVWDTPDAPGYYCSVILANTADDRQIADFDGATLAVNEGLSQSGWAAAMDWAGRNELSFNKHLKSGAHRNSAKAVAEGRADLAAVDRVTWEMIKRWDGFAGTLRVVDCTRATPALPYITAKAQDPAPMRAAMHDAIAALTTQDRETLCLKSVTLIDREIYLAEPMPPAFD